MYNDENLMNASEKPKFKSKTIQEIQKYFPTLPIYDIWYNPKMNFLKIETYENANLFFNEGRISSDHWSAFQAIWRNLTSHYSGVAIEFEIPNK